VNKLSPFYQPKFTDIIFSRFVIGIVMVLTVISFLDKKEAKK